MNPSCCRLCTDISRLQIAVLEALEEGNALHLLPSWDNAPGASKVYVHVGQKGSTGKLRRLCERMLSSRALDKAEETGSMVYCLAKAYAGNS